MAHMTPRVCLGNHCRDGAVRRTAIGCQVQLETTIDNRNHDHACCRFLLQSFKYIGSLQEILVLVVEGSITSLLP